MPSFKSHVGEKFGRLTVLSEAQPYQRKNGKREGVSHCVCDCGSFIDVRNCSLVAGLVKSCGCMRKEILISRNKESSITGLSNSRLYNIFRSMHARCEYAKHVAYNRYGGRGIRVDERWKKFKDFALWSIESGYSDNLTIDRVNPEDGYRPENCRWITIEENNRRRSCVKRRSFRGRDLTVGEISKETGVGKGLLYMRLHRGWSLEEAVTIKPNKGNNIKRIRQ